MIMGPLFIPETKMPPSTSQSRCNSKQHPLRKYVVLAHDCVAVKVVPVCKSENFTDNGTLLFRLFIQANVPCTWNPALQAALQSLTYRGHLTPYTVLLHSTTSSLNILRQAWSRRMLRSPPGYTVQMLGDIDEIFTQPIAQSQFAPLSDSLCWAIVELRATGSQAFVDNIVDKLASSFPGMEVPHRELVYQTLEKLIRDGTVHQNANGYFVAASLSRCCSPTPCDYEALLMQRNHIWGSVGSVLNEYQCSSSYSRSPLKRHHSMRPLNSSRREEVLPRPHMGARSLSFRLSKRNSLLDDDDEQQQQLCSELVLVDTVDQGTQMDQPEASAKKRRSFLRRLLLSFKKPEKENTPTPQQSLPPTPHQKNKVSSTQTRSTSTTTTTSTSSSSSSHRRRHSVHHLPTSESYGVQHRCSSVSSRRSRASSPSSGYSTNIYASVRGASTTPSDYRYSTRRRRSLYDLYSPSSTLPKDAGAPCSTDKCSTESDVSH